MEARRCWLALTVEMRKGRRNLVMGVRWEGRTKAARGRERGGGIVVVIVLGLLKILWKKP